MDHDAHRERVAALIAAARAGRDAEARLAAGLHRSCWPGGAADRTEPAARAWVRRWRRERLGAAVAPCTCRAGRCVLCN
jgi:hypothetical protein